MSRRLLTFFTILLLLAVSTAAYAQEPTTDEPIFVLTEEQINDEFTIPSTATRTISNVEVDVQSDGIHISFDMTAVRDGTSNTLSIIAILIGQVQENRSAFYDLLISSYMLEDTTVATRIAAPSSVQRVVNRLVGPAWRDYVRDAMAGVDVSADHIESYSLLMDDDSIFFYVTEAPTEPQTEGWCLPCMGE
jgi:hypothetical protein